LPGTPHLTHDDYCRIFGKVVLDAYARIDSIEKQLPTLHESFQAQAEGLRKKLADAMKRIEELESIKVSGDLGQGVNATKSGRPDGNLGT
jgi:hypothetical protein